MAKGYVSTVAAIRPNVRGLSARVVGGDDRLLLRNLTRQVIVIEGYEGEPYLRFSPQGVFANTRSPATYLNRFRFPRDAAPALADPSAPPRWWRVSTGSTYVAAAPDRRHRVFDWRVPGVADRTPVAVTGFLDYVPASRRDGDDRSWVVPAAALGLAALAAAALAVDVLRRRRR